MSVAIIAFTRSGVAAEDKIAQAMSSLGYVVKKYAFHKYAVGDVEAVYQLDDFIKENFKNVECMIFVGALAIAVRGIAPYIESKKTDPAVLVADEKLSYIIPVLSGHIGGANEIANNIASSTGALQVVTTATDINNVFAIDVFAEKNKLIIDNMQYAKEVSARLLAGEKVGICVEKQGKYRDIEKHFNRDYTEFGVYIGNRKKDVFHKTLHLIEKNIVIGVGCKRDTDEEMFEDYILSMLEKFKIDFKSIAILSSIDLKQDEKAIIQFAKKYNIKTLFYTAEELMRAKGDYEPSEFVLKTVGADNVCERSAALASNYGKRIVKKEKNNGMTIAIFEIEDKN